MTWTLLHDTRVRPSSPAPELGDVCVAEEIPSLHHPLPDQEPAEECEVPPLHHHQPASDRCSVQVMQREVPAASQPASPVLRRLSVVLQPASPEMLVKPVSVSVKRLVDVSVAQVLGLAE